MITKGYLHDEDECYGIKLKIDVNIGQINKQKYEIVRDRFKFDECDEFLYEDNNISIKLANRININIYEKYIWIGLIVKKMDVEPAIDSICECINYIEECFMCVCNDQILEINFYDYLYKEKHKERFMSLLKIENKNLNIKDVNYALSIWSEELGNNIKFNIKDYQLNKDLYNVYIYYYFRIDYSSLKIIINHVYSEFIKCIKEIINIE